MPSASVRDVQESLSILTVQQLQDFLGISRPKAYELVHTKGFPTVRIGRAIRVPKEGLMRWLDEQQGE